MGTRAIYLEGGGGSPGYVEGAGAISVSSQAMARPDAQDANSIPLQRAAFAYYGTLVNAFGGSRSEVRVDVCLVQAR